MNRTIASRFINFLPIAGMFILFFSLFMKWFSCGFPGRIIQELSFIDLLNHGTLGFYLLCFFSATCFLFASYFSNRAGINKYFILFLVILFPVFFCSMLTAWFMAVVGYHSTVDYPCDVKLGLWLHILGFTFILIGGSFRARRSALE